MSKGLGRLFGKGPFAGGTGLGRLFAEAPFAGGVASLVSIALTHIKCEELKYSHKLR